MNRIVLGMSGGVDSTAAALRLLAQGESVTGVTMLLCGTETERAAASDAAYVCKKLGIEHMAVDMRDIFDKRVKDYFVEEYRCGRTPNPCVRCNKYLKFGAMLDYARSIGAERIATGHYVCKVFKSGVYYIRRAETPKDQSYFLWQLTQEQIEAAIFPIGASDKQMLRDEVRAAGIEIYSKPDSQDICFVENGDYKTFLHSYAGLSGVIGDFVDECGKVLGKHTGIINYTVGQRKGLGGGFPCPMFVKRIDAANNVIVLGRADEQYIRECSCKNINIIHNISVGESISAQVKVRYAAKPTSALVTRTGEDAMHISFAEPQRAVTPGQSAVIYIDDIVAAGGEIE